MSVSTEEPIATKTYPVRVRVDLTEMLRAIRYSSGEPTLTGTVDTVCRDAIEEQFNRLPEDIRQAALKRIELGRK